LRDLREQETGMEASTWSEFKDKATLIETRIAHEINLMGQRMTWLVTSQAFLFAGWMQLVKSSDLGSEVPLPDDAKLLFYVVPTIGLGVAIAGWAAIAAAMLMVDTLVVDRAGIDDQLDLTRMSPRRARPWTRIAGHAPTEILPPLFVTAWLIVIVRELSQDSSWLLMITWLFVVWLMYRGQITYERHAESKTLADEAAAKAAAANPDDASARAP
jgi:hypothetical protein